MKTKNIYLIVVIVLLRSTSFSQSIATPKEILIANLKINQILPTDNAYVNSNWTRTIKWYEYYGSLMNNSKYLNSINDEFRSQEYKKALIDEILIGSNNQDLNKQFFVTYNLKFGTYNSDCQCFPFENRNLPSYTLFAAKDFANWSRPLMGSYFDINLTNFFNFTDIDFSLRLKPSEAERLIAARKDGYGTINRIIQAKVTFNFVNKPIESKKNEYNLGCYIHKIEFYDNGRIISTLTPKIAYYDKINLKLYPSLNMNGLNNMKKNEWKEFTIKYDGPSISFTPQSADTVIFKFEKAENRSRTWGLKVWKNPQGEKMSEMLYPYGTPTPAALVGECLVSVINTDAIILVEEKKNIERESELKNTAIKDGNEDHQGSNNTALNNNTKNSNDNININSSLPKPILISIQKNDTLWCTDFNTVITDELGLENEIKNGITTLFSEYGNFKSYLPSSSNPNLKKISISVRLNFSYVSSLKQGRYEYFANCNYTFKLINKQNGETIKEYSKKLTTMDLASSFFSGAPNQKDALGNLLSGKVKKEIKKSCEYLSFK